MIFRPTQKLNAKIKAGTLGALPLDRNPYVDWSAELFTAGRTEYIILANTKSLYSVVLYGKGITHDGRFIDRALGSIREFMEGDGLAFAYHRFIAPSCGTIRFAKTLSRSVTGSINDLILHATVWLTEGEMSPYDVGFKLNDIPFSSLAGPEGGFGSPREVFRHCVTLG